MKYPKFKKAFALAHEIPKRKQKKRIIHAWCNALREGLNQGEVL